MMKVSSSYMVRTLLSIHLEENRIILIYRNKEDPVVVVIVEKRLVFPVFFFLIQ